MFGSNDYVTAYERDGYSVVVLKVDNALTRILASTTLGNGATGGTSGAALALDAANNIYVTGQTWAPDFPVTPGAYDTIHPPVSTVNFATGVNFDAFVTEFSSDLSKIVASTLYGDAVQGCGFSCSVTGGSEVVVNSDGSVIIAGTSNSSTLRVGGLSTQTTYGFLAKFSANLGSLSGFRALSAPGVSAQTIRGLTRDSAGNILVVGSSGPGLLVLGAIQPSISGAGSGYLAKYDAALQNLKWGTYFGGGDASGDVGTVNGVTLDTGGNIWITGASQMKYLPNAATSSTFVIFYIAELPADGSSVTSLISTQNFQGQNMASIPGGALAVLGSSDSFLLSAPSDQPTLLTVTNAADSLSSGTIAPAELISLYGSGIGPATPVGGEIVNAAFTTTLGGYRVQFDGTPAPLLYAGADQINVAAPVEIAGRQTTTIQVVGPQGVTGSATVFVGSARPQLFAVVSHQDGTANSAAHPAPIGSVVTLWATGTGLLNNQLADGTIASVGPPYATIPVTVTFTVSPSIPPPVVEYAGQAPGAILGLTQINVQLPAFQLPNVFNVCIKVGDVQSDLGIIWVQQFR